MINKKNYYYKKVIFLEGIYLYVVIFVGILYFLCEDLCGFWGGWILIINVLKRFIYNIFFESIVKKNIFFGEINLCIF